MLSSSSFYDHAATPNEVVSIFFILKLSFKYKREFRESETKAVYSFGCIVHLSGLSLPADLKY
jgi:hypothetical protein